MKDIFEKINFIQKLHTAGLLTNEQGTELLNIVANSSYSLKNPAAMQWEKGTLKTENNTSQNFLNTQEETQSGCNDERFYSSLSRQNLKDFFKKALKNYDSFDEKMFKEIVQNIEKDAVEAHIREQDYSKNLAHSNDIAKGRLTSQTQSAANVDIKPDRIFTRKEIDSMTIDEFNDNESQIMHQMEQGLIQ